MVSESIIKVTRLGERTLGSILGSHDSIRMNIYVVSLVNSDIIEYSWIAAAPWPARYEQKVKASYLALGGRSIGP